MSSSADQEKHYEVDLRGDHIYLRLIGQINGHDLHQSTEDVLKVAKRVKVYKLIDDIRELDRSSVTIGLQTEAIGLLWKLRVFQKIALVYKDDEIGRLVAATLQTIHFTSRARAFDNEIEALAWLQE
ncbi:MAG TPA: STAS/SEC14 domain-containing protein [Candidatus Saccharimonadales bacterium]|nr:STAS/SEC14 domain-containing protein [Candidatus Saccharimonadales bacterium]